MLEKFLEEIRDDDKYIAKRKAGCLNNTLLKYRRTPLSLIFTLSKWIQNPSLI